MNDWKSVAEIDVGKKTNLEDHRAEKNLRFPIAKIAQQDIHFNTSVRDGGTGIKSSQKPGSHATKAAVDGEGMMDEQVGKKRKVKLQ